MAWPSPARKDLPNGTQARKLISSGGFVMAGVQYRVAGRYGYHQVLVITDGDKITVADLDGEIIIEHTRPALGVTYVSNRRPPAPDHNS